jgi:hypothetical protein
MPPRPIPCFPWNCPGARGIKRAASKALISYGPSKPKSESTPPAVIIGSFKLVNDKVDVTTDKNTSFKLAIAPNVKRALKVSGKANEPNQSSNYGMALVTWKKGKGPDAKVTGYFPFADLKNLATRLSKQRAVAIYDRWMYGG